MKWRLVWFREKFPYGVIETQEICVDLERGYTRFRAVVSDGEGGQATGYGTETAAGFADYVERAETRALGWALAALGIGTQFVGQDLTELPHVADAPYVSLQGSEPRPCGRGAIGGLTGHLAGRAGVPPGQGPTGGPGPRGGGRA